MKSEEPEHEFQIKPPKPRRPRSDDVSTLKQILRFARMSHSIVRGPQRSVRGGSSGQHEYKQRCAVRVSYSPNQVRGQWKAHGRYLARESATPDDSGCFGFGSTEQAVPMATTLDQWQKSGDERLFKMIISPEFGDRFDLKKLARELMARMETDLGTRLQWVATVHDNTEFPHVHVALRGVRDNGAALRLDRTYIQQGIRANAQDIATAQIGYRTKLDSQEAERREVHRTAYTSLDRTLKGNGVSASPGPDPGEYFDVDLTKQHDKARQHSLQARLVFLGAMGLADHPSSKRWHVRSDFETVLRAMQRTSDRQRTLSAHSALLSDRRLQCRVTDISKIEQLEGRVLGHGEEESTGRTYMLLEGTDRNIHFIYHNTECQTARQEGLLRPDSFVCLSVRRDDRRPKVAIHDFGDSKQLLRDKEYFRRKARTLVSRGIVPNEASIGGWLGQYEVALARAIQDDTKRLLDSAAKDNYPRSR
jgi:hypothetical protein